MGFTVSAPLTYLKKPCVQILSVFSILVTCSHGLILLKWQFNMLCTSSFVDDIMFSHKAANGPDAKMMRMFH